MNRKQVVEKINKLKQEIVELEKKLSELDGEEILPKIELETEDNYDPNKHGHAYVAKVSMKFGKLDREFLNRTNIMYNGDTYWANWLIELPVGTKLEARLNSKGRKEYFMITEDGYIEISPKEIVKGGENA